MKTRLAEAVELRKSGKGEDALKVLKEILISSPEDPNVNYQMAWTCDALGKESEAVQYYEKALKNGLVEDRAGAMLGLGSTYRNVGEYQKSLKLFEQAIAEFPEYRAFKVFQALTLYNLGQFEASTQQLLIQLLDTTNDKSITLYEKALRFYSDKLNEIWK